MTEICCPLTRAKFGIPLCQSNVGGHELVGHLSGISPNFRRENVVIFGIFKDMFTNVVLTSVICQHKKRA